MSVKLSYGSNMTLQEILEENPDSASAAGRTVQHNQFNTNLLLDADSTPVVSQMAAFVQALDGSGDGAVDLAALKGTNGAIVNGTGLKVQALKVKNLGDAPLTITPKADTGYELFGAIAVGSMTVLAGGEHTIYANGAAPDIGPTSKDFVLAGSASEESEWTVVMG